MLADRHTQDTQTDTLITILRSPTEGKVIKDHDGKILLELLTVGGLALW